MNRIVLQLIAPNTSSGNARNLMVVVSPAPNGRTITEAYDGETTNSGKAIVPLLAVKVPAGEYTRLRKLLPTLPEQLAESL